MLIKMPALCVSGPVIGPVPGGRGLDQSGRAASCDRPARPHQAPQAQARGAGAPAFWLPPQSDCRQGFLMRVTFECKFFRQTERWQPHRTSTRCCSLATTVASCGTAVCGILTQGPLSHHTRWEVILQFLKA